MPDTEREGLEICKDARNNCTDADWKAAEIIYNNIFYRDKANYRNWETARYQAPETHEGFALHICGYTSMQIRKALEVSDGE